MYNVISLEDSRSPCALYTQFQESLCSLASRHRLSIPSINKVLGPKPLGSIWAWETFGYTCNIYIYIYISLYLYKL